MLFKKQRDSVFIYIYVEFFNMRSVFILLYFFTLTLLPISSFAKTTQVLDLRLQNIDTKTTRLIFDLTAPVTHKIFTLANPHRLVIDLKNTTSTHSLKPPLTTSYLKNIRHATRNGNDLRIVLDLKVAVRSKSFLLSPSEQYGHRLVVDINIFNQSVPVIKPSPKPIAMPSQPIVAKPVKTIPAQPINIAPISKKDVIIAIDAGHGGIDPGATGHNGTREKDVVLDIAKRLATLIYQTPNMRPVMIRSGDYFIQLRKRIELAREHKADLFISIHADALPDGQIAHGSSVYMLSQSGASSEAAQWLAHKENSADLLGGINLSDKDDLLASVLLDLSLAGTLEASTHLGSAILQALDKKVKVHAHHVQQAAFIVLRSPDIPSILVETGFLSTPAEEQKLSNPQHRSHIARAIFNGIKNYLRHHSPKKSVDFVRN